MNGFREWKLLFTRREFTYKFKSFCTSYIVWADFCRSCVSFSVKLCWMIVLTPFSPNVQGNDRNTSSLIPWIPWKKKPISYFALARKQFFQTCLTKNCGYFVIFRRVFTGISRVNLSQESNELSTYGNQSGYGMNLLRVSQYGRDDLGSAQANRPRCVTL